jgi:hypothetical protein
MTFGTRESDRDPFERVPSHREQHVNARGTQPDDDYTPTQEVGVVVAFLELRTSGTFGALTLLSFVLQVP